MRLVTKAGVMTGLGVSTFYAHGAPLALRVLGGLVAVLGLLVGAYAVTGGGDDA